jgi:PBP1b-binding outer membrane lipoprotein LpoB
MEAVILFFISLLLLVTGCVSPGASPAATQEAAAVPTLEAGATSVPAAPELMTTSAQSEIPAPGSTPID